MTKVVTKKLLRIMGTSALVVALAVSFVAIPAYAQVASRDLPDAPVTVSTEFDVGITASAYGMGGAIIETLPTGFTYVGVTGLDDSQVLVVDQVVNFVLLGETAFTYTVMAPPTATTGTFAGILRDFDLVEYVIGDDTQVQVIVDEVGPTASRDLPDAPVTVSTEFDVGITASDYGMGGAIIETLPAGFTYVGVTGLDDSQVLVADQVVNFVLIGETAFSYTVMAPPTATTGTFAGILRDFDLVEYVIGDDTQVQVIVGVGAAANRDLPDAPVTVSTEFDVGITASDYGMGGAIIETLPAGFTYVGVTGLEDFQVVSVVGQVVTFALIGETAFSYTVMAPATATTGTFAGILRDFDLVEYVIGDDTTITVGIPVVLVSIAASPTSVSLLVGETQQLTVTATYSDASTADVTGTSTYVSDDETVATVSTGGLITAIGAGSATITVSYTEGDITETTTVAVSVGPEVKVLEFDGDLDKGERETLLPDIPAGVIDLEITLTATADIDLELYDGDFLVIGWHGEIDSAPGGTYQDDTFEYSGYKDGDEYITQEADGPLGRAYTLKVFGYKAGDYEVTVSYTIPVGVDLTPPEITITAPGGTVGSPVTITVSATDDTGVAYIWFGVWPSDYELTYSSEEDYQYVISMASGPGALVSVTFTPSSANSYYVAAWAGDTVGNWTAEDAPVTATWVVTE